MRGLLSRLRGAFALWRRTWRVPVHATLADAESGGGSWTVRSFDCFETLVQRRHRSPGEALALVAAVTGDRLHVLGHPRERERILRARLAAEHSTRDPGTGETTLARIHARLVADLGLPDDLAAVTAGVEMDVESDGLVPAPGAIDALARARARGCRVVVVSDMYWPTGAFARLFDRLGLPQPDRFLISGEAGASKRRGALFDRLLADEAVSPAQVLHIGDDPWADIIPARRRGIPCRWIRHPSPAAGPATDADPGWRLGREVFGPLLTAYVARCAVTAHHASPPETPPVLAFLARDGWILERIHRILAARHPRIRRLACASAGYRHLSRMSVVPAALRDPLADLLALADLQGRDASPRAVARAAGLPPVDDADGDARQAITAWNDDPAWRRSAEERFAQARTALAGYLATAGMTGPGPVHLIDIGWYGTIPMALCSALPDLPPVWYHRLGARHRRWPLPPPGRGPILPDAAAADEERGNADDQALVRFLAILETVCGDGEGTCLGYREEAGRWIPILDAAPTMDHGRRHRVQDGIVAAAEALSDDAAWGADPDAACRRAATAVSRLARNPDRAEALALAGLAYDIGWGSGRTVPFLDTGLRLRDALLRPRGFLGRLRQVAWVEGSLCASGIPAWRAIHRGWRTAARIVRTCTAATAAGRRNP